MQVASDRPLAQQDRLERADLADVEVDTDGPEPGPATQRLAALLAERMPLGSSYVP